MQSEPDPLKWGHSDPFPLPRVPFSTHRFVRQLEQNDVKRGMAIELMKATRELLLVHEDRARGTLLGRQDLENVRLRDVAIFVSYLIVIARAPDRKRTSTRRRCRSSRRGHKSRVATMAWRSRV